MGMHCPKCGGFNIAYQGYQKTHLICDDCGEIDKIYMDLVVRLEQLEAENAELRGRLFSLTCKECGDNLKSLYCPSCGRPMAQVVGQEYPSYAALRERVKTKCKWIPGEDSFHWEYWNTECGHGFKFEGGGLEDNEFLYCPYCGGPIEVE